MGLRDLMPRRQLLRLLGVSSVAVAASATAPAALARTTAAPAVQQGGGKLQEVLSRGRVIVGTGSTNPPWHFEDANGQPIGFDIEMAKILAKGLFGDPTKVEFVIEKADARIPNLLTDKVDIVFQFMTVNAQRAQQVEFTIPYYREAFTGLLPIDSPVDSAEQLTGQGVSASILQNVTAEEYVHLAIPDAKVLQFDSQANAVLAVDTGQAAVAMIDLSTAQWYAKQNPGKYKVSTRSWLPQTYAAAVKPGDQRWLNFVNTVLHEAMTGVEWDAYAKAYNEFFGTPPDSPRAGFPVEFR